MNLFAILHRHTIRLLIKNGLSLGRNVHVGEHVSLDPSFCWLISIGDECTLTRGVVILAHDASTKRHLGYTRIGKVQIGRKTFIGAHSVILPGVTIGENVIVGAGSVVTSDIPDNCVAVGNPAKVIKSTVDYLEEHKRTLKKRPVYPDKGWTLANGITAENRKVMREALDDGIGYVE